MNDQTQTIARGGSFLIDTPEPEQVFTPEDFSEEALLLAQTTREFVAKEIEPEIDRLEAKDNDFMVELMQKAGEIGLLAADVPEDVRAEDDRLPPAELLQQLERLPATDGVEPGRRLVPDQDLGVVHEGGGDGQAGPHAGRVAADPPSGVAPQADRPQERPQPGLPLPALEPEASAHELEVADRRELLGEGRVVREEPHPLTERLGLGEIRLVLLLNVPEEEVVGRISGRRQESAADGERDDDKSEVVIERMRVYRELTEPLVDYYRSRGVLQEVDGVGAIDDVFGRLDEAMRETVQA